MDLTWLGALLLTLAPGGPDARADAAVSAAREALRARLSVPASRIDLVDVAATRWNDSSLGCPEKGRVYAQVITDGHTVHLRVDDRTFDVRVAGGRAVVCEGAGSAAEPTQAARVTHLARRDLASRLGIAEDEVRVERVRPRTWPDGSLGCGGANPPADGQGEVQGFLLELTAGGRRYEYHADAERVVACAAARFIP